MKKNDALSKFEANLFTLIKSYQNSNLISDSIVLEITNLYNNFKAKVTKNYDKHSRLIERIALRKNYALEESNKIIENLNNQYMLRVERIKKVHKNNIFNLNNEIYQLQQINKENLDKLNDDYQLKCQQIKANEDIIREALELNNNTLHANQAKVVKDYTVFLDQKAQETSQNIKKIHAYYSRQIMLTGEEDSAKLLDIDSQIEELEKKLTQINKDYVQQKSKIELNKLEATTDLNNEIRMKTKTKNYRLHQEKENNIIKQKDIKKQLDYFEEQYSEKIDKKAIFYFDTIDKNSLIYLKSMINELQIEATSDNKKEICIHFFSDNVNELKFLKENFNKIFEETYFKYEHEHIIPVPIY